ncbi:AAA family ATPase [Roseobacter sp. HKCCA0434]|uniref:AAA family ATPase n=1 Tax=Roseobacter sp. HKCCA0434 TaxID=3079297 RepID=UPI002905DA28|nr:AAA family ATPase [Roseobacter sp. HKCCA0434]
MIASTQKAKAVAIYHFNVRVIGRTTGGNAVASAAYRHGTRMVDDLNGRTRDYSGKADEVAHAEIGLPENAPEWARAAYGGQDATAASARLWSDTEGVENQTRHPGRAQLARSFTISLPIELTLDQQIELGRDFIKQEMTDRGMVADWVIHAKEGNPHMHVMVSMRTLGDEGWGPKERVWNQRGFLRQWRFAWAELANLALERAGHEARIDARSLADQGIALEASHQFTHAADTVEASGEMAETRAKAQEIALRNAQYLRANPEHMLVVMAASKPVFSEAELRAATGKRVDAVLGPEATEAIVTAALASGELVALDREGPQGEVLHTSRVQVEMEARLVEDALRLSGERIDLTAADALGSERINSGKWIFPDVTALSEDQKRAVSEMMSGQRLSLVTGHAGAGKTHAIAVAADMWRLRGWQVLGGALSGKAAAELAAVPSIEAGTLAQWEARFASGALPQRGRFVFVLDEAGMVGAAAWARLQARVDAMGGKLVAVGDGEQLQPVSDGSAFRSIEAQTGSTVIEHIRRQSQEAHREATRAFATGDARAALATYQAEGAIRWKTSTGAAIADLSHRYVSEGKTGETRIALAWTNREVALLNAAIRMEAASRGQVDLSEQMAFRQRDGREVEIAKGDRVRFTRSWREGGVTRSTFATIEAIEAGKLKLRIDGSGVERTLDPATFAALDYGYAATVHKAQGMSVDHAHVLASPGMNKHLVYVAMSRHRESVALYVPQDRISDLAALERIAQRSGHVDLAEVAGEASQSLRSLTPQLDEVDAGLAARQDAKPLRDREAVIEAGDAEIVQVSARASGLLAAEWQSGDPVTPEGDPRGYVETPERVVEDLLAERSVIRAADVAERLSAVVAEPDAFRRLFAEAMSHDDLIVLAERDGQGGGRVYSSLPHIERETAMADRAGRLAMARGAGQVRVAERVIARATQRSFGRLSGEQEAALRHVTAPGRLALVTGLAGSGKSSMLDAVREVHETVYGEQGGRVIGTALAGRAAAALEDSSGIRSRSLAALMTALDEERMVLGPRDMVVLDEAGMIDARAFDDLLMRIERSGAKLVAVGDPGQLQPLRPGGAFRALVDRIGAVELTEIRRQADETHAKAVRALSPGGQGVEAAVEAWERAGVLVPAGTAEAAHDSLVTSWLADPAQDKVALAHARADVERINRAIRGREAARDADIAEAAGRAAPEVLRLTRADGAELDLGVGTRVLFTANDHGRGLLNGMQGQVVALDARDGSASIRVGQGAEARHVKVTAQDGASLDYGYAMTVHRAQGLTVDSAHVLMSGGYDRHLTLVGLSRHRDRLKVYMPRGAETARAWFTGLAARDRSAGSVLDHGFDRDRGLVQAQATQAPEATALPRSVTRALDRIRGVAQLHMPDTQAIGRALRAAPGLPARSLRLGLKTIGNESEEQASRMLLRAMLAQMKSKPVVERLPEKEVKVREEGLIGRARDAAAAREADQALKTRLDGAMAMVQLVTREVLPNDPIHDTALHRDAYQLIGALDDQTKQIAALPRAERDRVNGAIAKRVGEIVEARRRDQVGVRILGEMGYSQKLARIHLKDPQLSGVKAQDKVIFKDALNSALKTTGRAVPTEIDRLVALAETRRDALTTEQQRLTRALGTAARQGVFEAGATVTEVRARVAEELASGKALDPTRFTRDLLSSHTLREVGALATKDGKLPASLGHIDTAAQKRAHDAMRRLPENQRGLGNIVGIAAQAFKQAIADMGWGMGR